MTARIDEDVGRLYIPVEQPGAVNELQSLQQLIGYVLNVLSRANTKTGGAKLR